MIEKSYYIALVDGLEEAFWQIENDYPCFTEYETIEMNYIKATICARIEDICHIERILAPFV